MIQPSKTRNCNVVGAVSHMLKVQNIELSSAGNANQSDRRGKEHRKAKDVLSP